ncbi:MAG: radical SAM protein [Solirubrobacteraceae bacterium]|nr:radical SAM protein [Solirubrobacteraceae bacterium]
MLSVTRLLNGQVGEQDALRYGRADASCPPHLLHFTREKKPVVVWNSTQRCNLHCAHCYSDSKDHEYPGELTTEEGFALLDDLAAFGVPTVLFSGGEPLMRHDLFELAAHTSKLGMRTVLSTNGTRIDDDVARRIADAGFAYVGVSIDAIGAQHDKLRGKKGAYERTLAGIAAVQRVGVRTGLRFTLHGMNRDHLGPVFELAEELGVNRLCIYHLAYAGRGEKIQKHDLTPAETREAVEEIFDRVEDLGRRGSDIEVLTVDNPVDNVLLMLRMREGDPDRAAEVERLLRFNGGNQSGVAVASIDPQGWVHPDQFSWHVRAGNVRERPFSELWNDENPVLAPYRVRPRELNGRCSTCAYVDLCNGGLRVRAESATGDTRAPDPACYLTDEEIAAVELVA